MVTNISIFQDFVGISKMDIYKCPKSIFGNTFGKQKLKVLYILTIFILKEQITQFLRTSLILVLF
jgi:hypothetical protein